MLNKAYQQGNTFLPFLALIAIAILATANIWLYVKSQKEIPIAPTVIKPTATTTNSMADWQTFYDSRLMFSFKYPNDWYKWIDGAENEASIYINHEPLNSPQFESFSIYIKEKSSLDTYDITRLNPTMKCVDKQSTKVSEYEAISYSCSSWMTSNTFKRYILANNNSIYDIRFNVSPNAPAVTYDQILSTFRFIDDMSDWKIYKNEKLHYQIQLPTGWWINEQKDFTQILPPSIKKEDLPSGAGFGGAQSNNPVITISRVVDLELGETIHNIQDERKITINTVESTQRQENGSFGNSINTYIPQGKNYIKFSWDLISTPSDPTLEQILSTFKFIK